ncbi:MAG: PD-(D/E)XK nuclease family protein [Candidatus Aceula meridiana]|nr:PD-(D/E)XK nuclease family protein [Candidatus Aceula meridiana]
MMRNNSYKRTRNLFNPKSKTPFKLSRSRLEMFSQCPRCFYLDRRLGVDKPSMPAFTLNSAVDALLKKEFDVYRARREPHPLMEKYHVDAIPFAHSRLDTWRENFVGVQAYDTKHNLIIFGAIDDLWIAKDKKLYVVDYKATSTKGPITLDGRWKEAYKRQMEIYQWLLRRNEFDISDTGYFVYCNAGRDRAGFEDHLDFDVEIIPYKGSDAWVDDFIDQAHACLMNDDIPDSADNCEHCQYRAAAQSALEPATAKAEEQKEFLF